MSAVINSNAFKSHEIKCINYCGLYLGVTTLSDITLTDGETLEPHMRSGNIFLLSSSAKQILAKQGHPNQKSLKTWSKCLKLFANIDQLKVPLKQWLIPMSDLQRNWPIYLDYNKDIIYVRLADKFCQYSPSAQNSHIFTSGSDTEWTP
eukprot:11759791-Ditylum_brightwellii.AAC.1